jgi:hypothetical protein
MARSRGGRAVDYDLHEETRGDLGRGVGRNPYRRRFHAAFARRVHPALLALLVIVLLGLIIRLVFL